MMMDGWCGANSEDSRSGPGSVAGYGGGGESVSQMSISRSLKNHAYMCHLEEEVTASQRLLHGPLKYVELTRAELLVDLDEKEGGEWGGLMSVTLLENMKSTHRSTN